MMNFGYPYRRDANGSTRAARRAAANQANSATIIDKSR